MSAERPGGISPNDPRRQLPDSKTQREEAQKIEKVGAVDPDAEAQRRKQKFQTFMEERDTPAAKVPGPFESEFYVVPEEESSSFSSSLATPSAPDVGEPPVPSPAYSPPPDVHAGLPPAQTQEEEVDPASGLPRSESFWADADLPPDSSVKAKGLKETPQSAAREAGKKTGKAGAQATGQEDLFFDPSGKLAKGSGPSGKAGKKESGAPFFPASPQVEKGTSAPNQKEDSKKGTPTGRYWESQPEGFSKIPDSSEKGSSKSAKGKREQAQESRFVGGDAPFVPGRELQREEREKSSDKESQAPHAIEGPSFLPQSIQPLAQAATTQALPYLSPQTVPLFFQMVGMMYYMISPPGISRTEIVLNNPSMANSKFFGATITIEKYATAPDSFNIRLTGSNAAVSAFRENTPSLMTAFQNGNFTFRVHRLETEFEINRPVFRRREKGEDRDSGGDLGERRK
jgi:hypothetical protein